MVDFAAIAAKAVEKGVDMTQATKGGGGDYVPPAEGPTRARLVAYIELGKQDDPFQGKPRKREKCLMVFELSGPKHPPVIKDDGTKMPIRITVEEALSLNDKANFFKIFQQLNYAGKAKHIAQLLGEAYKAHVYHRKYKRRDGTDGVEAELRSKLGGYSFQAPRYEIVGEDGPTGEMAVLKVDPAITPIKMFLWDHADMDQWNSLFIEGTYEERKNEKGEVIKAAKSKNVFQNRIKLASNFIGSPIHALLAANGQNIDIPDAEDGKDPDAAPADDHDVTADIPGQSGAVDVAQSMTAAQQTDALAGVV